MAPEMGPLSFPLSAPAPTLRLMGVQNSPKGFDLFLENGWRHEVAAVSGLWELRVYPERVPPMVLIARRKSLIAAEASVTEVRDGWAVAGMDTTVAAHEPFPDPRAAFDWWVATQAKARP